MFTSTRKRVQELKRIERDLDEMFLKNRREIQTRLNQADSSLGDLDKAIKETKELTAKLASKLSNLIRNKRNKTLISIIDTLDEGCLLVDGFGKIIELNKIGESILGVEKDYVIGQDFSSASLMLKPTDLATGEALDLSNLATVEQSQKIIDNVKNCENSCQLCTSTCENLKKEAFHYGDQEIKLEAYMNCIEKKIRLSVMFLVFGHDNIDNIEIKNINYLMMFSNRKRSLKKAADILYAALK